MTMSITTILTSQWLEEDKDESYEEFCAKKGIEWMEEMSESGDINMSFEEFIMTPFIDEALASIN